jgi:hypothetical protein
MSPEQKFRAKYTYINEETIKEAALKNPELLKEMILVDYFRPLTTACLIEGLGNLANPLYFEFILSFLQHENPLIQESVVMSLSTYYVEDFKKYIFIKDLLIHHIDNTQHSGVKEQIKCQLDYMDLMTN